MRTSIYYVGYKVHFMFTDSYDTENLLLEWFGADPVEVNDEDLELPQFDLSYVDTNDCVKTYKTGTETIEITLRKS